RPKTRVDTLQNVSHQTTPHIQDAAGDAFDKPPVGNLTASADAISLDFTSNAAGSATPQSSLLEGLPQDAWLAVGLANVGDAIKNGFDQAQSQGIPGVDLNQIKSQIEQATGASFDQLTHALGDAALYVSGSSQQTLTGALVVQSNDTGLTDRLLDQLQSLLSAGQTGGRKVTPLRLSGGGTGFELTSPANFPRPIEIAEQGDKIVIGYGPDSATRALQGGQTLS